MSSLRLSDRDADTRDSFSNILLNPGVIPTRDFVIRDDASVLPESIRVLGRYRKSDSDDRFDADDNPEDLFSLNAPATDADVDADDPSPPPEESLSETTPKTEADDGPAQPRDTPRSSSRGRTRKLENPAGWPIAESLHDQLHELSGIGGDGTTSTLPPHAKWAAAVSERIDAIQSLSWLGDPRAGAILQDLVAFAKVGEQLAEASTDRELQLQWLRSTHALSRRLAVWGPVWKVVDSGARQSLHGSEPVFSLLADDEEALSHARLIRRQASRVATWLTESGDAEGWRRFLLIDEITAATFDTDRNGRAEIAQRFLSRLQWYGLHEAHKIWLQSDPIDALADSLRTWSVTPIDYAKLVRHLERQENDAIDLSAIEIADAVQSLRFSRSVPSVAVATAIGAHYRNANLRFAVSDQMLRRLLPPVPAQVQPVRTNLLGSRILGTSETHSDLDLRLIPAPDRWSLELNTDGNVRTRSVGLNGPVAVRTIGKSLFRSSTPIELLTNEIKIGTSRVFVNNQNRLQGIRSDYDGLPLIGSLVRSIAADRFDDQRGIADRFAADQIERNVRSRVDSQVRSKMSEATRRFSDVVVGPLGRLGLEPMVVDMETTSRRLLARYRVAGDWQMAAFTPRPRAPYDSLMSLQIHQSAINNILEQMVPRDEPVAIADMVTRGLTQFGIDAIDMPDDWADEIPDDALIQFATTRPITVEIEDDCLWLTLRIVELKRAEGASLRRFIVRAKYEAVADGAGAKLVRTEALRISGPRMSISERLPVRAIFNKVLDADRPLPITMPQVTRQAAVEGLVVSQLELRDGWIALALGESSVGEQPPARVAAKP